MKLAERLRELADKIDNDDIVVICIESSHGSSPRESIKIDWYEKGVK